MANPKLSLSRLLRRRQSIRITYSSSLLLSSSNYSSPSAPHSSLIEPQHLGDTPRFLTPNSFSTHGSHFPSSPLFNAGALAPYNFSCSRSFSTRDSEFGGPEFEGHSPTTPSEELSDLGFGSRSFYNGDWEFSKVSVSGGGDSILPVQSLISLLDGFHDLTGLPWWMVIVSSTLALRVALLPILYLQLLKLKRIAELLPTLPPPLPPPLSGRSYKEQFTLFREKQEAVGCPSFLWFLAYISIQIPCFLLGMTSIRRMSLDHHSGFDYGGTLWFQNLTELPHGILGSIFPLLIAGLHLTNVQVSLQKSSVRKMSPFFGLLVQYYKNYLRFLTVPILVAGFCVPQGSLVYWVTNSSFTLIQQVALNDPHVRKKLGLPDNEGAEKTGDSREVGELVVTSLGSSGKHVKVPVQNLSPPELVNLSIQVLAKGNKDRAIPLLRLALDKDPEYVRALIVIGQTHVQDGLLAEASEYLERAITKLFFLGHPTEVKEVDNLIVASLWAGVAYARQGKNAEALVHLERIARLKEPEDIKSKTHYFDGLLILASTLLSEGRNAEAVEYVRILVAHDPAYSSYLKDCENGEENFVDDLVNSRRRDY